jgi:hypothetical protein
MKKTAREIIGTCFCDSPKTFLGWGYPSDGEADKRIEFCRKCGGFVTPPVLFQGVTPEVATFCATFEVENSDG